MSGAELIKGLNPYNEPEFYRIPGVKTEFSGNTPIPTGSGVVSGVVNVEGYSYVVSKISADQDCTIIYQWYTDYQGTILVGSVTYSYIAANGPRVLPTPTAADFLKISISNNSGVDMTFFSHRLTLDTSPTISLDELHLNQEEQLVALSFIQTEINDEALANRNNETAEHTATRITVTTKSNEEQAKLDILEASLTSVEATITAEGDQTQALLTTIDADTSSLDTKVKNDASGNVKVSIADATTGTPIKINPSTSAIAIVDYPHHEVHQGSYFFICNNVNLGNGGVFDISFVTPNTTTWAHMLFNISANDGEGSFKIFEGATVNVAGTALTPRNSNRNSLNASVLTARIGDTFTATGTDIYTQFVGSGKTGGKLTRQNEIILKQNTTYIFRVTNETSVVNDISYCAEWYEHANHA